MAEQTGIWYHGAKWEVVEGTRGVVFDPHGAVLEFRDRDWAHDNGLDKRVVAVWNALAGVEDPAAALRAAREALEEAIVELQEWAAAAACDELPASAKASKEAAEKCKAALAGLGEPRSGDPLGGEAKHG